MLVAFSLLMALGAGFASPCAGADSRQLATVALEQAELAVRDARDLGALWTTAVEALRAARAAFAKEDFAGATALADRATEQARLGITQLQSPSLRY